MVNTLEVYQVRARCSARNAKPNRSFRRHFARRLNAAIESDLEGIRAEAHRNRKPQLSLE